MGRRTVVKEGMVIIFLLFLTSFVFADVLPEDPTRGERLLLSKGCLKCHAVNGEGGKIGPDLVKIDLGDTPLGLAARLWNHTPSMLFGMEGIKIAKPTLTEQEFTDILVYLYSLRFFDRRGNREQGRSVFTEKGCHFCHPLAGKGRQDEMGFGEFPRNMSLVFLSKGIWNHSLDMVARMAQIGMKWPNFRETEMTDLLEYIKANAKGPDEPAFFKPGNPKQGKQLFDTKGCDKCHSIRGRGAMEGVEAGKMAYIIPTTLTEIASNMWNKGPAVLVKMAQQQSGIPKFTSKEMADLFAYLYFLPFSDEPGSIRNGEKVFSETGCSECHGLDKRRGKLMYINHSKYRNVIKTDLVASIWNHSLEIKKDTKGEDITWPLFGKREMADLLEFIRAPK